MAEDQVDLFGISPTHPAGFRYLPNLVDERGERQLAQHIAEQNLAPFEFHGFLGKRRVVSFGHRYEFGAGGGLKEGAEMPAFLVPIRSRVASAFGLDPAKFVQALLTAAIGWHRDRPVFWRRRRYLAPVAVNVPLPQEGWREVGAAVAQTRAAIRLSAPWPGAHRVGAQHSGGDRAALLDHLQDAEIAPKIRTATSACKALVCAWRAAVVVLISPKQLGVAFDSPGVFASRWFVRDPYKRCSSDSGRGKRRHSRFLGPLGSQLVRSRASPVGPGTDDQSQP
jgi:hypothetical protein